MNWENRFSTMVKESSAKIDQAKRRLQNIDTSRINSLKNTGSYSDLSPASFQNNLETSHGLLQAPYNIDRVDFQSDPLLSSPAASVSLLHTLWEKVERQSKDCDLLKTKVEALQTELTEQQKGMDGVKEQLSQLCHKVDTYGPAQDGLTLEEWKTKIKSELNNISASLKRNDADDLVEWMPTRCDREGSSVVETNTLLMKYMNEIKNRLDKIESELSSNYNNTENNSKMVEKNVMILTDWKNSNEKSFRRLCKTQDLSVDEVKHLRSKLYGIQDKVHELETAMDGVRLNIDLTTARRRSNSNINDNKSVILENEKHIKLHDNADSSEEDQTSLSGSSLNLDVSDDGDLSLENDEFKLNRSIMNNKRTHSYNSELADSSLDSISSSENSLTDI